MYFLEIACPERSSIVQPEYAEAWTRQKNECALSGTDWLDH